MILDTSEMLFAVTVLKGYKISPYQGTEISLNYVENFVYSFKSELF